MLHWQFGLPARAQMSLQFGKASFSALQGILLVGFLKTVFRVIAMTCPLTKKIKNTLEFRGVELHHIAGFRHSRPSPLGRLSKIDPVVEEHLERVRLGLPEALLRETEGYNHSGEERNIDLMAQGFTVQLDKPVLGASFEVFYFLFLQTCLEVSDPYDPGPCTLVEMFNQVQPTSSCGNMPLNSLFGSCTGYKKEMQHSAVAVNAACGGVPGLLPYKPVTKEEVIKKGKKVRTIMIESQPNVDTQAIF